MEAIRVLSICVFQKESRILVAKGFDAGAQEYFLRPLGGGVEFGEMAVDAMRREIQEELAAEVKDPMLLGVLENVFEYEGRPGHEVVFVFDAKFANQALYSEESIPLNEQDIWDGPARWIDIDAPLPLNLYPDGLVELLSSYE